MVRITLAQNIQLVKQLMVLKVVPEHMWSIQLMLLLQIFFITIVHHTLEWVEQLQYSVHLMVTQMYSLTYLQELVYHISGSGQISSTITQYADSDVQSYSWCRYFYIISSTITQYSDSDAQAVSINNVVEDTTPQLGGNLDLNSSNITGTGNIDTTGNFTLTSTSDTSSAGPIINLVRESSSPADADYLGQIKFKGEDDGGASTVYAKITGKIDDASAGTEDGLIEFATIKSWFKQYSCKIKNNITFNY